MLSKRNCIALCLVSLAVGILIGGSIEAANHHNQVHLMVMPWGDVNVSPDVGDVIDWMPFDQSKTLTINFNHNNPPCDLTSNNICAIKSSIGPGVYLYDCSGTASCPDPGVGPGSSTSYVGHLFDRLMVRTARVFGYSPIQSHRAKVATVRTGSEAAPGPPAAGGGASARGIPNDVYCESSTTKAPDVSGSLGQTIYWTSSQPFTLAMSAPICKEDTSKPNIVQQCTLQAGGAPPYTYTALETSCSAQPSGAANITVR
jgi:hypothetical protein